MQALQLVCFIVHKTAASRVQKMVNRCICLKKFGLYGSFGIMVLNFRLIPIDKGMDREQ